MAVGQERAHAEFVGQGEGLAGSGLRPARLRGIALRGNLAEEAQGIRLVAAFLVLTGERQRALGEGVRLLQVASQHLRFPQGETTERLTFYHVHCNGLFHRLREQRHGVNNAPAQSIRLPQGWSHPGGKECEVCVLTDIHGPFSRGSALGRSPWRRASRPTPHEASMRLPG